MGRLGYYYIHYIRIIITKRNKRTIIHRNCNREQRCTYIETLPKHAHAGDILRDDKIMT